MRQACGNMARVVLNLEKIVGVDDEAEVALVPNGVE